jgi:hypothetical protein
VRAELIDRAGNSTQVIESAVPRLARGELRRDQIGFWLPPEFPAGAYDVRLAVLDENRQVVDTLDVSSFEVTR